MTKAIRQGDILKVENLKDSFLVVSKDFFNTTELVFVCPIVTRALPDPLHIPIKTADSEGSVLCEQLRLLDLRLRGYKLIGSTDYAARMDIADAIQGIFDYM